MCSTCFFRLSRCYFGDSPDCFAPPSFAGSSSRIPFPSGTDIRALFTGIRHLPPGQIARPQITRRRPPKLLNRRWVIRQVSHCGKPQRTASPKKPLGFSAFAKLASGLCPLGSPSKVCPTSAHRSRLPDTYSRKSSTGYFSPVLSVRLRVPPLHPAKGIASPWNPTSNIINLKGKHNYE